MSASKKKASKKRVEKVGQPSAKKKKSSNSSNDKNALHHALLQTEKRLNLAINSANIGLWDWDMKTNSIWWSENVNKIFGTPEKTFVGTYEAVLKLMPDEDKKIVSEAMKRSLEGGKNFFVQHRIKKIQRRCSMD